MMFFQANFGVATGVFTLFTCGHINVIATSNFYNNIIHAFQVSVYPPFFENHIGLKAFWIEQLASDFTKVVLNNKFGTICFKRFGRSFKFMLICKS